MKKINPDYIKNFLFGAQDGLVSTFGVLFGIASSQVFTKQQIFIAGIIAIFVEASSMGVGAFLSEEASNSIDESQTDIPLIDGIIMFFSYLFFGFLTLLPYIFFEPNIGRFFSLSMVLINLFLVGYLVSKKIKYGLKILIIAGFATLIGFFIGNLVSYH